MSTPVIGYAGLTHLGINSAVASAARGFQVVGYSEDPRLVIKLNRGELPVGEPQLYELLSVNNSRITFSSSQACLASCDIVYISVDVPTSDLGASDLAPVHFMIETVTASMHSDALLVILCQVPPGFTRLVNWPLVQLYYQVETLVFGHAVQRALHPERFILGLARPLQSVDARLLSFLQAFDCPILPMRYESAELAKIAINMFLVASVTTANTLAELCEEIGADWAEIVPSLRLDKRIGSHAYIAPGLGIAGGNLERDLATVIKFAQKYSTDASSIAASMAHSYYCKDWAWRKLDKFVLLHNPHAKICVLGLTYKEDTRSTKNSAALFLLKHLTPGNVTAFDPEAAIDAAGRGIRRMPTVLDALAGADVLLIMTPWKQFHDITVDDLKDTMRGTIVIDPYRMLGRTALQASGFTYITLGAPVGLAVEG